MTLQHRTIRGGIVSLLAVASVVGGGFITSGCGKKDPTMDAAPPASPGAVPETNGGQPKPNAPMNGVTKVGP